MTDDPRAALFPDVDDPREALYWEGTLAGELRLPRCLTCKTLRWPATLHCPECLSDDTRWEVVPPTGTLWSYTIYRRAMNKAFRNRIPYAVGLIELDAGVQMIGALEVDLDALEIGMSLRAEFESVGERVALPVWKSARTIDPVDSS